MPGIGRTARQSVSRGVVGGEQQKDLGLEGIGVLELVDEKVREALLQLAAHAGVIANEIARLDEEIEEIEPPRLGLQEFVVRDRRLQRFVEQRREIGVARRNEGVEIGLDPIATGQDFVPRQGAEGRLAWRPSSPSSCRSCQDCAAPPQARRSRDRGQPRGASSLRRSGQSRPDCAQGSRQATSSRRQALQAGPARPSARRSRHSGRRDRAARAPENRGVREGCASRRAAARAGTASPIGA